MASQGLTVAVTGPTGDLGLSVVDALEGSRAVKKVVGMARRPFDPAEQGWKKTEYRQGDVQDEESVRDTVKGADVVVHLAFSVMGEGDRTRAINVDGSRTVFETAAAAGVQCICYASSVAAYGFHADNPAWLTEDVPTRGTPEHYYSAQKAEVESVLARSCSGTSAPTPTCSGRASSPALEPRCCSRRCPTTASPLRCPPRWPGCCPRCRCSSR